MSRVERATRPDEGAADAAPLLEARDLSKRYRVRGRTIDALRGVSLSVRSGESLALVGESASGKSTLARCLAGRTSPTAGRVLWRGRDLGELGDAGVRRLYRHVQLVAQDAGASLDPRMRIGTALAEPLRAFRLGDRVARRRRVEEELERLGLPPSTAARYPRELSGGQRQRAAIARATILRPEVLIADEPLSALDVSVEAQTLNLLLALKDELGLALLLIAHDLSRAAQVAERVVVLDAGRIVEEGPTDRVFHRPHHPHTVALLAATPWLDASDCGGTFRGQSRKDGRIQGR